MAHFCQKIEAGETPWQAEYRREQERLARAGEFAGWWGSDDARFRWLMAKWFLADGQAEN